MKPCICEMWDDFCVSQQYNIHLCLDSEDQSVSFTFQFFPPLAYIIWQLFGWTTKQEQRVRNFYFILFSVLISVLTSFVAQCEEVCFWVLNVCAECLNCIRTCFISSDNFMPIKSGCTWNGFRRCMFFIFAASLEIVLTANFFFGWGVHHTWSSFRLYVPIFNWIFWSALLF